MLKRAATALLAACMCLAALAASARADGSANVQADFFEPHYGQSTAVLNLPTSTPIAHLRPTFGAFYHLADGLLKQRVLNADGGEATTTVLGMSHKLAISAGLGLAGWIDVGVTIPLVISQDIARAESLPTQQSRGAFSVQDVRVGLRARLMEPEATGLGLALGLMTFIPTGDPDAFTTDQAVRLEPKIIVDWRDGDLGLTVGLNLSVHVRPRRQLHNLVNGDSFRWGMFVDIELGTEQLHLLTSIFGSVGFEDNLDPSNLSDTVGDIFNKPVEVVAAVRYWLPDEHVVIQLGGGAGLTQGLGAPTWRLLAGIDYSPQDRDADDDGVTDSADACPKRPEDKDGFEDADGCPDPDNDADGVLDTDDRCPTVAEDMDRFQDTDGCPEFDNDGDGHKDSDDRCPLAAEDADGFQDADGCPDPDNDADGIADGDDTCPEVAEDTDGFQDADGCPDPDNDADGIADSQDTCPDTPENANGYQDEDGCPDDPKARVHITKDRVAIAGRVNFATGKARLKGKRTFALLDEVAQVLLAHPQIAKIRVEGHTDDRGNEASNMRLSDRRAAAVRGYLISKGVAAHRMVSQGFGESRPKAPNTSHRNRAKNRRTEFFILEINRRPVR